MALVKAQVNAPTEDQAAAVSSAADEPLPWDDDKANDAADTVIEEIQASSQANTEVAVAVDNTPAVAVGGNTAIQKLADQGYSGLKLDWTSFPTITLKPEGHFEDIDRRKYGQEFRCRVQGTRSRWVYRGNPVTDNKRDVLFSYDRVHTEDGRLMTDALAELQARGKVVEEREYSEALVEMVAPGEEYDGEFRMLSISPKSIGRFSGKMTQAMALGNGNPYNVIFVIKVGTKVEKVANPFYPWAFDLEK